MTGIGSDPLPASVAVAALDLTDEQRLAVARELWPFRVARGYTHMDDALHAFEREALERLAAAQRAAE